MLIDEKRQDYLLINKHHGNLLDQAVSERFALLNGLFAFTLESHTESELSEHFNGFAEGLYTSKKGIRNFSIAPKGIHRYVYPLKGNENVPGHDLINDKRPNVRKDVQRTIESGNIVLSGPYILRQGGMGLVARKAVHMRNEFWGLVAMVIDMAPIYEEAGIQSYKNELKFALRRDNGNIFYGEESVFKGQPVIVRIDLPEGYWELAAIPEMGWVVLIKESLFRLRLLGLLILALLALLIYTVYSRQSYLKREVQLRTSSLNKLNEQLSDEINERKQAEAELEKKHSLLSSVTEGTTDAVFVKDIDGRYIIVNGAFSRALGRSVSEIIGKTDMDIFSPETGRRLMEADKKIMTQEKPLTLDEITTVGNVTRSWQTTKGVYYDADGNAAGTFGIARDVTELKLLEEERRRTGKLESIGTLAGGIAHDFNNLLSGIRNNVHLLMLKIDKNSREYKNLESAEKAISRAAHLTQQLLTFSRGGSPIKKTISIINVVKDSAEFALRGSNVKCEYNIAHDTCPVEADEGQINQVIQNLIINADQSMPEGGIIRVSIENIEIRPDMKFPVKEGKYVKLRVEDQGVGIAEQDLKNVFDPYFTTKEMGRGLGLSITYSIIKNHGGHISVESEPGAGTTFAIYLPASEKRFKEEEIGEDELAAGEGKVLIMDDEEIIRDSMGELLRLTGYEIECAKDGSEAIALYKKAMESSRPFDAVILDLTIRGGMGGKETVKKLLEIDPGVKAIVASGYSNDPVLSNYRDYGFIGVFAKHEKADQLVRILQKVINKKQ